MYKECAYTRKSLNRYLRGHLFRFRKNRITRHLQTCEICRSEFQVLKQADETRRLLNNVSAPGGVVPRLMSGISGLVRLKKIFYRPLWLAGIALAVAAVYSHFILPGKLDIELDNIAKSAPTTTALPTALFDAPVEAVEPIAEQPTSSKHSETAVATVAEKKAEADIEPLVITITVTPDSEKQVIDRINKAMRAQHRLRGKKFTGTAREISGSLVGRDLIAFLKQIEEETGAVAYNAEDLASAPKKRRRPFIMHLKVTAGGPEKEPSRKNRDQAPSVAPPGENPVEPLVTAPPSHPSDTALPSRPSGTAPSPTAAP